MKTVGIILRDFKSKANADLLAIREDLLIYLCRFNIQIIGIPVSFKNNIYEEWKRVEKALNMCQGIILPGGMDAHEIDEKIVNYLYDNDIPTLGICLGMQLMALAFNGNLEYLKDNTHQSIEKYVHTVQIKQDSKLYQILGSSELLVNSRHIEHITSTNLTVSAVSEDLCIEAIEDARKRFFIGVQWHPESLYHDGYSKKLFMAFINAL